MNQLHQLKQKLHASQPEKVGYILLILLTISQLGPQRISYILSIALAAWWLIHGGVLRLKSIFRQFPILWLFVALFTIQLIGLTYTENFRAGRIAVEQRLSLLLFPLIIFSWKPLSKKQLHRVFALFTYAWFLLSVVSLILVYQQNIQLYGGLHINSFWLFSHHNLTNPIGFDAIMTALQVGLCMIWLTQQLLVNWKQQRTAIKLFHSFLLAYFFGYQVLLASRTIFFAVAFIIYGGVVFCFIQRKQWLKATSFSIIIPALCILALSLHPTTWARVTDLLKFGEPMENTTFGGYQLRLEIWESAWQVIQANPVLGVGTGDAWDEILIIHQQKNFQEAIQNRYHAHNQYIQDWMTLGVAALVILLANLFYPMLLAIRKQQFFYFSFLFLIAFACMTDITLGFYKGIFFFALFNSLLMRQLMSEDSQ